ncbi:MAG: type II toxin-antitoxin system Phd/YefM family antitoxin [Eubacteriales bacterium]|nr:type II toxin-antitoxin system Phd/YefM family antitoxin [Eubacteriales bacterium]
MMIVMQNLAKALVPISLFNRGQASKIFDRLSFENILVVLKNNVPTGYILSPKEYERYTELEENYILLSEAYERLLANENKPGIPMETVMANLGITQEELDTLEDVEIE